MQGNIDLLNVGDILKKTLKKKSLIIKEKDGKDKDDSKDSRRLSAQRRVAQLRQAPARAARIGAKNIEGRIRNRTFKIKKTACTAKSRGSKKYGRIVHRITVRRSTVYPAEVRTRRY